MTGNIPWTSISFDEGRPFISWDAASLISWLRNWQIEIAGSLTLRARDFRMQPSTYRNNQEAVRNFALDWQDYESEAAMSYRELADWGTLFETLGRRCGLLTEFRENGIC